MSEHDKTDTELLNAEVRRSNDEAATGKTIHPDDVCASMRASLRLSPLTEEHLPAALELWAQAEGVSVSEGDSLDELRDYLARNPGMSQAMFEGGSLVGALLAGHDGRRGYLYHLAVSPSHRQLGLGRRLVEASLAALKARGLKRVLILLAADNASGRAFWQRCGWEGMDFAQPMGFDL